MGLKISDLLKKSLDDENDKNKSRIRSNKWNPSKFGQCYRRQVWNRKNEPMSNPPDDRILRVFKVGNIFEKFILSFVPDAETQVKVEDDNVLGYADSVTGDEVIEIKTQHSMKFWYNAKEKKTDTEWSIVDKSPDHVMQGMYYVHKLNKKFLHLVYVSKDDLSIDEYTIPYTDSIENMLASELAVLDSHWKSGLLPPAHPRLYPDKSGGFKECSFCSWKTLCENKEKECKAVESGK